MCCSLARGGANPRKNQEDQGKSEMMGIGGQETEGTISCIFFHHPPTHSSVLPPLPSSSVPFPHLLPRLITSSYIQPPPSEFCGNQAKPG